MNTPLITIKALQKRMAEGVPYAACSESAVRRMWWAALDTLQSEYFIANEPYKRFMVVFSITCTVRT